MRVAGALAGEHRAAFSGADHVGYLLAATSLILDAEPVTTNVHHFPMLDGLGPAY